MSLSICKDLSFHKTNPTEERLATPPGPTSPTLFKQFYGFFYALQEPAKCKDPVGVVRFFVRFSVLIRERLERRLFADVITKVTLPSQLLKDPECWLPARQTGALPTELTRQRLNTDCFP